MALALLRNFPTIIWSLWIWELSKSSYFALSDNIWLFLPCIGCVQGYDESWVILGYFCCKTCSGARTYPGIESWTVRFSYYHFCAISMYNFSSQYVVILYLSYSADFRCRACSFPEFFTPNLLTTKMKLIGRLSCVHIPRFLLEVRHP